MRNRGRLPAGVFFMAALLAPSSAVAQKTDVISLDNGSSIVGEIKELERAKLRVKLYAAGTAYVEWEHVTAITTDKFLEIELVSGVRLFGSLSPSETAGRIRIIDGDLNPELSLAQIVHITPIRSTFWSRTAGAIEFGSSFTKANSNLTYSLSANVDYRGLNWLIVLSGDSYLQTQTDAAKVSRSSARLMGSRLLSNRWRVTALTSAEANSQLDLDYRGTLGAGPGRSLIQNNQVDWGLLLALSASRERPTGGEASTSVELMTTTDFRWFLFGDHKTDLRTTVAFLPSLSDWGRVRISVDASFKRDLIKDFFVSLTFWDDFDSGSGVDQLSVNDLGITFGVGYSW